MKRQRIEHQFAMSASAFWEMFFFDQTYFDGLYNYLELNIEDVKQSHSGTAETLQVERTVQMSPRREMPALMSKLLKGVKTVTEIGRFSAADGRLEISVRLPVIASRVDYGGIYTWREPSPNQLLRVWDGHCDARIPMLGGKLESFLLGEIERDFGRVQRFTQDYIGSRG
ncbi:MAG: DUF2505 family protein [Myxococcales bacterium]|nr:DUF2505 family protein [Myxococcales bacterium]